ncbi:outer-membrane lipoprotein carrier protein LolA [Candidatus Haliotispira prima]|uniref:Outer-membrane lipoprotein carrier protein LolA n=1 Tax=Candidatus Haliotispira prima TaxID=3034016 RepID=A0ABY8MH97_9SPIO|nr:outer-membrane lipoprotein carrier protein LolA [Candidatus Haliotispira prima]
MLKIKVLFLRNTTHGYRQGVKIGLLLLLLSGVQLIQLSPLAAQETVSQFFTRAETAHQKIQDYKALWRMNINEQNSVATAYYKTPGNVLLKYNTPSKRFILITNTQLVIYNHQNKILMTQPLEGAQAGPPSLRVMRRLYSMRYKYPTGSQPVKEEGIGSPVIVLLLNPINSSARIEELQVSFYPTSLLMRQVKGSWYGSKVEYNFLDIQTNIGLEDTIFDPKNPPGAKEWAKFLQD